VVAVCALGVEPGPLTSFSFISYLNARKKGQFLHFRLKIAEKEGKTDLGLALFVTRHAKDL